MILVVTIYKPLPIEQICYHLNFILDAVNRQALGFLLTKVALAYKTLFYGYFIKITSL